MSSSSLGISGGMMMMTEAMRKGVGWHDDDNGGWCHCVCLQGGELLEGLLVRLGGGAWNLTPFPRVRG
jgi:hypothetical protein